MNQFGSTGPASGVPGEAGPVFSCGAYLVLRLTRRRVETPPMSCSPDLRARTNIWMPVARAPNLTCRVGVILKVTHPSGPVAASGGVVVVPNGSATTKTSAPWTEWLRLSETWKRAVNVRRERKGCGMNWRRSIKRRLGSATSLIGMVAPPGASALAMTAVGADVAKAVPALLRAVTCTRSVVPSSAEVRMYVLPVAPLMSGAAAAAAVTAPPLIGERDRLLAGPGSGVGGERLPDLWRAANCRRRGVGGRAGAARTIAFAFEAALA